MSGGTVGIVLAGGRGARLGPGPPKALRPFGPTTLLERTTDLLATRCEQTWVAVPPTFELPPGPWQRVDDLAHDAGPLGGLVPALERAAAHEAAVALVLAVDLPDLGIVHLDALARALDEPAAAGLRPAAVVPRTARGLEPVVGAYRPVYTAPVLRAAWNRGERSLHGALAELGSRLRVFDVERRDLWPGGAAALEGVNTPEQFERAVARLVRPGGRAYPVRP